MGYFGTGDTQTDSPAPTTRMGMLGKTTWSMCVCGSYLVTWLVLTLEGSKQVLQVVATQFSPLWQGR